MNTSVLAVSGGFESLLMIVALIVIFRVCFKYIIKFIKDLLK